MKELTYSILSIAIMALFFYSGRYLTLMDKQHEIKDEIKPCVCTSAKQYRLYYERYEMFLNQGKKDSVAKYASLLKF